jgi:hypothetical protein
LSSADDGFVAKLRLWIAERAAWRQWELIEIGVDVFRVAARGASITRLCGSDWERATTKSLGQSCEVLGAGSPTGYALVCR